MNLIRTVQAQMLGDGLTDRVTFSVFDLPDARFLHSPSSVISLTPEVQVVGLDREWISLAWKEAPEEGALVTVSLCLGFPEG